MNSMVPDNDGSRRGASAQGGPVRWIIPYVDQPVEFWHEIAQTHAGLIREVYFPVPANLISSGEPPQQTTHLQELLRSGCLPCSALLNGITLSRPVEDVAPPVIEHLKRLVGEYGLSGATVTNLTLGARVREALPSLHLAGSCLMQISMPNQALMVEGILDSLVPDIRILRDLPALRALHEAFSGRLRLMVNECCLPGCPLRVQHFHEMGGQVAHPMSLCAGLLHRLPWMRLTTGWVLPQHLHLYDGVYDDIKLAGRVTLRDPRQYRRVLDAYIARLSLTPDSIGGGPANVLTPLHISEEFFRHTLDCGHECHTCTFCRDYFTAASRRLADERRAAADAAAAPSPPPDTAAP